MVAGSQSRGAQGGAVHQRGSRRPQILVAESNRFSEEAAQTLRTAGDLSLRDLDRAELLGAIGDCEVLWVRLRNRIDAEILSAASRLRMLVTPTTGLDHVDLECAAERGVRVLSLRGEEEFLANVRATAEHTLGLTLALMRQTPAAAEHVREGGWDRDRFWGTEIYGKTVGLVGYGRLGHLVAASFGALGAEVLATDPKVEPRPTDGSATVLALPELLERSHIVSMHASLDATNRRLIGREQFDRMRQGAYLVNTARGGLVDEEALLTALRSGRLAGAALDVIADEHGGGSSRLIDHARRNRNLLITPHIGGAAVESREKTEVFLAGAVERALAGERS